MHNFFLHKNILIFRRFFNSANRLTIYILSSYRVSIKGYCPMKTYLEQLEQLEQLERLPENHFCFDPVTGTPEVPISSRKPHSVLSLFTLAAE